MRISELKNGTCILFLKEKEIKIFDQVVAKESETLIMYMN